MFHIVIILLILMKYHTLSERPNIIFILADDLDTQYGNWTNYFPKIKTLLSDKGLTFTNAYVSVGLCCPSRASLLTGRYAHNTKIMTNHFPNGGFQKMYDLNLENSTIATWLQNAGYRTALFGKYLNGYPANVNETYIPPGWTEWYAGEYDPYKQFNYTFNQNGKLVFYGLQPEDYLQDVLKDLATDFINRTTLDQGPFFMWISSFSPHRPAAFAPRYAKAFSQSMAPRPPSFNDPNISPPSLWTNKLPLLNNTQISFLDNLYRRRLKSMLAIEDTVEAIIDALNNSNQLDNTYIFFSSDNGYHLGQHRMRSGKNTEFEEDICVPLIVRGPNIPQGINSNALVLNNDIAPTFAELANASWPETIDGRSMLPLLFPSNKTDIVWRRAFLIEHWTNSVRKSPPLFKGIHTKDKVFIEYSNKQQEYYDIEYDPYERNDNVSGMNQITWNKLSIWLRNLQLCAGQSCRILENFRM
jgi:N-acetylglucosamine-6-sulfatase